MWARWFSMVINPCDTNHNSYVRLHILQTVEFSSARLPMLREPTVQMSLTSVSRKTEYLEQLWSAKIWFSINAISLSDLVSIPVCEHCTMTSNNVQDTYRSAYSSQGTGGGDRYVTRGATQSSLNHLYHTTSSPLPDSPQLPYASSLPPLQYHNQSDTQQSVGLPWTSDRYVAETSTWQHTTITREKHPCPRRDSNPQSQQASGRKTTP